MTSNSNHTLSIWKRSFFLSMKETNEKQQSQQQQASSEEQKLKQIQKQKSPSLLDRVSTALKQQATSESDH